MLQANVGLVYKVLNELISLVTHPILRIFKHVGHTASVLLVASQQLSQADRQEPHSEAVKGHCGEFHGSGLGFSDITAGSPSCFLLHSANSKAPHRLSHSPVQPTRSSDDWQTARPIGGQKARELTNSTARKV